MSLDYDRVYTIQIPLRAEEYNYEFSITIGDTVYIIWMYYNRRMDRWIINIKDEDNEPIVMGVPILVGAKLLSRFAHAEISDIKYLFASNLKKNIYEEIGEFELGKTSTLFVLRELD